LVEQDILNTANIRLYALQLYGTLPHRVAHNAPIPGASGARIG